MALIKCQECGKEISDTSKKCIHCGAKIKKEKNEEIKKNKKKTILIILSVFLFIGIILTISFFLKSDVEQTNLRDDTKNQIEIITDYINIREMQDVSSDILGKVYRGEIYTILSENTDSKYKWLEIETSNGIRGYISGIEDYVKRLETTVIIDEEQKPNIEDNDDTNNIEEKPNNTKPDNSNDNDNTTNIQKTFKVYFNTNGGNAIEPKVVKEWENVGSLPTPTKDGYVFQYWEYNNGHYNDEMYLVLQSDITLNAVWKKYISQEERVKARDVLDKIVKKYGYNTYPNGGNKYINVNENIEIAIYFTLGNSMVIRYHSSPQYYCFYNWNKIPTFCSIEPDEVSHDKMEILFPYEEQLFNDVDKIYNEYIATGYTLEHLEPTNYN